jgi:hypothetical protein
MMKSDEPAKVFTSSSLALDDVDHSPCFLNCYKIINASSLLTKWLIRTTGENRLLYMYRPLAKILPQDWVLRDDALEKTI